MSGVGEDGLTSTSPPQHGWASWAAVLNALVVLHAGGCGQGEVQEPNSAQSPGSQGPEEALLQFLNEQEGNPLLDLRFALRVCTEKGLPRVVVLLYGLLGLHEEAVDVALARGDVGLAKHNAHKPADKRLKQRLWLRIVESQAADGVETITGLIRESQELSVRDVLPYMSDSITIDAFQKEICECLDTYEEQILNLRQEMGDHRRALEAFKEDLKQAEERVVVIPEDQGCEICALEAAKERFYVFACKHCFHEACLRALVVPALDESKRSRLFELEAMRLEHQAAAAGALSGAAPSAALAEVEDELDGILADDCPLCGWLMIQTIKRPFVDEEEQAEIRSWAIDDGL